jgi:hypothetical protein
MYHYSHSGFENIPLNEMCEVGILQLWWPCGNRKQASMTDSTVPSESIHNY